jgi:hypothetical protein
MVERAFRQTKLTCLGVSKLYGQVAVLQVKFIGIVSLDSSHRIIHFENHPPLIGFEI